MIKWLFRWAFRLLVLLVVLAVAAVLLLNPVAKEITEYRIKRETGMDVKIGKLNISILNPGVTIENFVLYNSAEFGGSPFIDLPELHVEYERGNFFAHKSHYKLIRINLAQLNVVEDKKGRTNLEILEKMFPEDNGGSGATNKIPKGLKVGRIDTLNLTLGKATFMSMNQPRQVDELRMNVHNQVVTNIKADQDLSSVLLAVLIRNGMTLTGNGAGWLGRIAAPPAKK
ncbi:MAG TPA: hypothetical protein VFC07_07285 [Verrucomicrobiae bacterium]|nr:hypothetical protein [Verrucomicrobiae bacterium]